MPRSADLAWLLCCGPTRGALLHTPSAGVDLAITATGRRLGLQKVVNPAFETRGAQPVHFSPRGVQGHVLVRGLRVNLRVFFCSPSRWARRSLARNPLSAGDVRGLCVWVCERTLRIEAVVTTTFRRTFAAAGTPTHAMRV